MAAAGEIPKAYDPRPVEQKWYAHWEERGYFTPQVEPGRQPFVIIMPPPNITGELHLGHAVTATLEDIMARWHRMRGEPALWLPGEDHAGIAAQNVVERLLATEGKSRHDLGREGFMERMMEWAVKYRPIIADQHRRLGASCDWTRERFTMDPGPSLAVRTTFVRLYEKGLIYRGERIINWCPRCATALSDLEVEHQTHNSSLWHIRYPLEDGRGHITVATTRPETMLGDTAVAVNPRDGRYRSLVGKRAVLPILNRPLPIIPDEAVDPAFGTGAVKVTPAHDPTDFEIAQRHRLPTINIFEADATMSAAAGPYQGLERYQCRQALLADLQEKGFLVKTEPYLLTAGHCQRCQTMVEPIVSLQWFVRIAPLAAPAREAVADGRIKILPERFTKVYDNWMANIRDWCISRQLWWGHRIPVWYCGACGGLTVPLEDPRACRHCGSHDLQQDPDVLDTWFSSALWPHSTLGWPQDTPDRRYFYPTSVMETGYDNLFFWVARMIMMGLENTGQVPFRTVYLHGLIRDEKGEKMSKSRGNVINPLEAMDQYGTDALRNALTTGTAPGQDMKLSPQRLEASRNFTNKLWNAARFILINLPPGQRLPWDVAPTGDLLPEDRWILSRLNGVVEAVGQRLESFQFSEAQKEIQDFLWGEFCDWYIEMAKLRLGAHPSPAPVLAHVLERSLRLLHPFMPFITEEIWQRLRGAVSWQGLPAESIMVAPFPAPNLVARAPKEEAEMGQVIAIVRGIRNARAEHKVEPSRFLEATVVTATPGALEPYASYIQRLARVEPLRLARPGQEGEVATAAVTVVLPEAQVYLPLRGLVNLDKERQRLQKDMDGALEEVERLSAKLADAAFLARAPQPVVAKERARLEEHQDRLARLRERFAQLP
ncbi:MAG: valine--tRNA ligase [Chloroflexi bacterium]|nr:valine--tRNA ligase [Chloroflexota bacterium]